MISCLLKDANTWIDLRRQVHDQVETILRFCVGYSNRGYGDQAVDSLRSSAESLRRTIDARINKLDESTSVLVQLVSRYFNKAKSSTYNSLGIQSHFHPRGSKVHYAKSQHQATHMDHCKSSYVEPCRIVLTIQFIFLPLTFISVRRSFLNNERTVDS